MHNDSHENSYLPFSSTNESLETISRNKLSLLLNPNLFEVRQEIQRDKGIDLIIEVKQDNYYTNFRFPVQLKSTSSIEFNKDNSISFPIEVTNIHYLLNYGMPAYYILYEHQTDKFYVEKVHDVYHNLATKYHNKKFPIEFTVRFHKLLDSEVIQEIYKHTLENGMLLKNLNLQRSFSTSSEITGIVIDKDNEVYSIDKNIAFIDQFGFELLNNLNYDQIISIEQRTHPRSNTSAAFNAVCGIAYYHKANLLKALEFLKEAQKESNKLDPETQTMIVYMLLQTRYLLGMINEENFKIEIAKLMDDQSIGSFLQLEKANDLFNNGGGADKERIKTFYKITNDIISREILNKNALMIVAYARILDAESEILAKDLSGAFLLICGQVRNLKKTRTYKEWLNKENEYANRLNSLFSFAFKQKNYLAVSNLGMDKIRWTYRKIFLTHIFNNWNRKTFKVEGELNEDDKNNLIKKVALVEKIAESYVLLGHTENLISCLSLKYELLHLAQEVEDANITSERIIELIESNDFNGLRINHEKLINGGTSYERFTKSFTDLFNKIYEVAKTSGLEEYLIQDISEHNLAIVEKDIEWSIENFLEFQLPE